MLGTIQAGDVIASVDGFVLSGNDSVEDAVRLIDEPRATFSVVELLLLREVPDSGVLRINASIQRNWDDDVGPYADIQFDESALGEDPAFRFSPRSFDSSAISLSESEVGQTTLRYRSFYSLGSFDTQISSRQQSPRGERRGPVAFRDVRNFGDEDRQPLYVHHSATPAESGVGLFLKLLSFGDQKPMIVVGAMAPGGAAHACRRIMVGDALLSVDGQSVDTFASVDDVADALMGPQHSSVMLQLRRALTSSSYTVTLVRRIQ